MNQILQHLPKYIVQIGMLLIFCCTTNAHAATRTAAAGGGVWSSTGTWVEGVVPVAGDDVTIGSGITVTTTAAAACATLNVQGTLTLGNFALTVTSAVTISGTLTTGTTSISLCSGNVAGNNTLTIASGGALILNGQVETQNILNNGTIRSLSTDGTTGARALAVGVWGAGAASTFVNNGVLGSTSVNTEAGIDILVHRNTEDFTLSGTPTATPTISGFYVGPPSSSTANNTRSVVAKIEQNLTLIKNSATSVSFTAQNGNCSGTRTITIQNNATVTLTGTSPIHCISNSAASSTIPQAYQGDVTYNIANGATLDAAAARLYLYTTTGNGSFAGTSTVAENQVITFNIDGTFKAPSAIELVASQSTQRVYVNVGATGKVIGRAANMDARNRAGTMPANPATISSPTLTAGTYTTGISQGSPSPAYIGAMSGQTTYLAPLVFKGHAGCTRLPRGVATITMSGGVGTVTDYRIQDAPAGCTTNPTSAEIGGASVAPVSWFTLAPGATYSQTSGIFWIGTSNTSYNPVTISSPVPGGTANKVEVSLAASNTPTVFDATRAINRTWNIGAEAGSTLTSANLTFGYNNADKGVNVGSGNLFLLHHTGSAWETIGTAVTPTAGVGTDNQVTFTGITTFSPFSLGVANVLPVELLSFGATQKGSSNLLEWVTTSEKDNASFAIERSSDGKRFETIGTLKGQGTTSAKSYYEFIDETPLSISYYRLRQTDYDGAVMISKVVSVVREKDGSTPRFYPSVTTGELTIDLPSADVAGSLTLTNAIGQVVLTRTDLFGIQQLNISHLAKGIYFVTIKQKGVQITNKLFKE